jgi:TRAP-type C4-dicarboxylate transport system substrate-binding protein
MKKKRFLLVVGLALIIALAAIPITGCPAEPTPTTPTPTTPTPTTPTPTTPTPTTPATYEWKISQPYPSGTMLYELAEYFVDEVDTLSDGRMQITHYPGELLGGYEVVQQGVAAGDIELAIIWPTPAMNPKWNIYWVGSIMYNMDQAYEAYGPGGWLVGLYDEIAEGTNWKILGTTANGADEIQSIKPFDIPDNPTGIKIRVQAAEHKHAVYRCQGYSPITMPMSEVSSSLALGTIDAACGTNSAEFRVYGDAFNYLYAVHDLFSSSILSMNLDLWNSLPAADQDILLEAGSRLTDKGFELIGPQIIQDWNDLYDFQVVVSVDGDSWGNMANIVRTCAWAGLEHQIGADLVDEIRAHAVDLPFGMTIDQMGFADSICTTDWILARQPNVVYSPEDLWPGAPET